MAKRSEVMRVDSEFIEYAHCLQRAISQKERKVPSLTEVTQRIARESVHPYEEAKKGVRKIGGWKF